MVERIIPSASGQLSPGASVSYQSQGTLLVIAQSALAADILDKLPDNLRPQLFLVDAGTPQLYDRCAAKGINWRDHIEQITIQGYLGNFAVEADSSARNARCGNDEPRLSLVVDLVLDLLAIPSIQRSVLPIGYFHPTSQQDEIELTLQQLGDWVGEFDKPVFFTFNSRLCAHQSSGISGCSACIDSCAAEAISSEPDHIAINPYLCQGCGDCTLVCPSGAIRYNDPAPEITMDTIRQKLQLQNRSPGQKGAVLFYPSQIDQAGIQIPQSPENWQIVAIPVESCAAVGPELWLAALAYGASAILLLAQQNPAAETQQAMTGQVRHCNDILQGAGLPAAVTMLSDMEQIGPLLNTLHPIAKPSASFAGIHDKRTVFRLAMDWLIETQSSVPAYTGLGSGAPFGEIVVDGDRCTLCMSCVSICPQSALVDGLDEPKLSLIEANCVQCGICKNGCPEDAITLVPRYLYDSIAARRSRVLNEGQPFNCVECGEVFATRQVMASMQDKLKNHPMFQGPGLRRLQMCETCRAKSFFSAGQAE